MLWVYQCMVARQRVHQACLYLLYNCLLIILAGPVQTREDISDMVGGVLLQVTEEGIE